MSTLTAIRDAIYNEDHHKIATLIPESGNTELQYIISHCANLEKISPISLTCKIINGTIPTKDEIKQSTKNIDIDNIQEYWDAIVHIEDKSLLASSAETDLILTALSNKLLEHNIETIIESLESNLIDSDNNLTSKMAETNAWGYELSSYKDIKINQTTPYNATATAILYFEGEQNPDRMYVGTRIRCNINIELYFDDMWEVEKHHVTDCRIMD